MPNHFSVNVEAAIYRDGAWLICQRSDQEHHAAGVLSFIGGTVEHGDASQDTLESGLIREIAEEIGVTVSVDDYICSTSFTTSSGNHVIDIVFLCSIVQGDPVIIDPAEIAALHWMTGDEVLNHPNTPPWLVSSMTRAVNLV